LTNQSRDRFEDDPWIGWLRTASPLTNSDGTQEKMSWSPGRINNPVDPKTPWPRGQAAKL